VAGSVVGVDMFLDNHTPVDSLTLLSSVKRALLVLCGLPKSASPNRNDMLLNGKFLSPERAGETELRTL